MLNENLIKIFLSKIIYSLILSLFFVIINIDIVYSAKIKNCINCGDGKPFLNNEKNNENSGNLLNDISCLLYYSNSPHCKVKRLSDSEICENIISWNKNKVISEQLYKNSQKEKEKRKIICSYSKKQLVKNQDNIRTNNSKDYFVKCPSKKDAFKHNCWGILRFSSGNTYKGFFKNNRYHGNGIFIFSSTENRYEGNFKNGKFDGLGKWTFGKKSKSFGSSYLGMFKNNKYHGHGKFYFKNGDIYNGEMKNGVSNGSGKYFHKNGDIYIGGQKNGKRHGKGNFTFKNGGRYVGSFEEDKYHGIGVFYHKNGDKFVGNYIKGKRYGKGSYYYKNGDTFSGEYKLDKMDGHGKFVYASNSKWSGYKYVGGYKNNLRNGFGIMSYPSGDNYKGGWKNDKKHGSGVYIFADGKIKNGFWQNGKIQYYKNKPIKNHKIIKSPLQVKKEKQKILELKNKIALLEKKEKKLEEEERKRKLLERKIAILEAEKYQSEKKIRSIEVGSGFFVSKFRHIVTNHHVIGKCKKITVGSNFKNQIPAEIIASDKRNDLAILQISSMQNASNETKAFVKKLAIKIVPVIAGGLIRSEDVFGGEEIFVAGYPLGNMISDQMKLTDGIVSATKGIENDVRKFEISSIVRKGNSGGPIYDKKGNIVGVVVERVNVSRSDNANFAIKGSTVKQFLTAHNVPTKWSNRQNEMDTKDIYKIASKQTLMVVCYPL